MCRSNIYSYFSCTVWLLHHHYCSSQIHHCQPNNNSACQPNNNCHSRGAGIYALSVILKRRHAHPCFSPSVSFPESRTVRPARYHFTRSCSRCDTHTLFTPRGENECLCVIQQPPRFVLALTRGACQPLWHPACASRWSETSTAVPSDSLNSTSSEVLCWSQAQSGRGGLRCTSPPWEGTWARTHVLTQTRWTDWFQ